MRAENLENGDNSISCGGFCLLGFPQSCMFHRLQEIMLPRSGFPFLRGPAPYWATVLDIIFRCGQETRRRARGRDA